MYISPPNATPWAAACDKAEIYGNFNKGVREEYAEWASDSVGRLKIKDKEPIPCPDYGIYASWILQCYNNIIDDAVRAAYQKAYFPNGLKLSMREDVDSFGENHAVNCSFGANAESDSDLDPGTESSSANLMKTVTVTVTLMIVAMTVTVTAIVSVLHLTLLIALSRRKKRTSRRCTLFGQRLTGVCGGWHMFFGKNCS